jgi:hypothetical protein
VKFWLANAINCAVVALAGGPGFIMKEMPSRMTPIMPLSAESRRKSLIDVVLLLSYQNSDGPARSAWNPLASQAFLMESCRATSR